MKYIQNRIRQLHDNLKKFSFNSILVKNFVVITILEISIIGILTGLYADKMEDNMVNEIRESSYSELKRSAETIESIIDQMVNFAYNMSEKKELSFFFMSEKIGDDLEAMEDLQSRLSAHRNTFEYMDSVYIYSEVSDYYVSDFGKGDISGLDDVGWMPIYEEISDEFYVLRARCVDGRYPYYLTMLYPIYNARGEKIGAIVSNINLEELNDAIGRSYKDLQCIYMLDKEENVNYSSVSSAIKKKELIPDVLKEIWNSNQAYQDHFEIMEETGKKVIVASMESEDGKRTYWFYSPMDFFDDRILLTNRYIMNTTLLALFFGLIFSYVLAIRTYRPIQHIIKTVEMTDEIKDEFIKEERKADEIQYISNMILSTKREKTRLKMEVEEWVERLGYAQLQALQSQINPHFLYNTLDTINWMLMEKMGMGNEISKAIYSLAKLLRISTKRSSYLIELSEELEHAKLYMELLNIRYPDKLKVHWEVEAEAYKVKVVRLCLQPILENAVRHGLRSRMYRGNIFIKGNMVNDTLILRIEDDGVGMSEEDCLKMNGILNTEYQIVDNHVGIKNVNQRIKILFGEDYGIQLRTREKGGLVVVLALPQS